MQLAALLSMNPLDPNVHVRRAEAQMANLMNRISWTDALKSAGRSLVMEPIHMDRRQENILILVLLILLVIVLLFLL
ncbi:hypothetical protein BK138_11575 [Paenibacillus rhizosphaerae]|uniref:Uncharacterized protein n=2 Tax=Paenibacillus TaxID=44249 RepID=A0A1R1EU29_9BACL|nr:hypothetical protein BK138_11575 [Paenibacillus rhizosphaerae]